MTTDTQTLGAAVLAAYILLRESFAFVKTQRLKNGKVRVLTAGEQSPEFWQSELRKSVTDVLVALVIPILANQTAILSEMRTGNQDASRSLAVILDRLTRQSDGAP